MINENGSEYTDSKTIADAFNKFFSNIGVELANNIPIVNKSPYEYLTSSLYDSLFLYPTSSLEIEDEITKLNCSKTTGPFSIPVKILKVIKNLVSKPLETIFNASFLTGIVPKKLKLAKVIPIYKTGLQNCLNNYRPISLLSIFDELLENVVYKRLYLFLREENIVF